MALTEMGNVKRVTRRTFLRENIRSPASTGLGLLAASCLAARPKDSAGQPPATRQRELKETRRVLKEATAIRAAAQQPLPDVYASVALETVYVIRCGSRNVLVDTGFVHNWQGHLANFERAGVDLASIDAILVTHFHVDHAAGLAPVRQHLRRPVFAHKNAVEIIQTGNRAATAAEMPYIPGWDFPYPPCKVDEIVEDGDEITIGSQTLRVVHLAEHTPACTGYLWDGKLITGDVVFSEGALGWDDVHWGSNYLDVIDSMRRIADLNPRYVLPAHLLPFPYEPSVSANAERAAKHMLEEGRAGPISFTARASRAATDRMSRRLSPSPLAGERS